MPFGPRKILRAEDGGGTVGWDPDGSGGRVIADSGI
jgi:hypothetical protein